jgi:acyl carrier protein
MEGNSVNQRELIGKLAEALFEPVGKLTLPTALNDLDGWDSLGRLSITALFHETFGMTLETQMLKKCTTVQDIINLVSDKFAL